MATAKAYATQVYAVTKAIAAKMGFTIGQDTKPVRVLAQAISVDLGVLMKLLVDKGLVTNQELTDAYDFVGADSYPDEPVNPG